MSAHLQSHITKLRTTLRRSPVGRTILGAVATMIAASFLIYALLDLAPGDPISRLVGTRATDIQREAARSILGLDRSLPVRYWNWLVGAFHGDFGTSITYRQDAAAIIGPRIVTTITLVAMAALFILVFGICIGAFGGLSERSRPVVHAAVGVGIAIPAFVAASVLIGIFAVRLGWFPTFGSGSGFSDRVHHMFLPAVALALGWSSYVAQMTSVAVGEQKDKEYVATATGRGLPRSLVLRRHVFRNAALPVMTASGLTVAGLVAGSVVVETAFGLDGIGSLLVNSVSAKDYPVVLAISMIIVVIFVVVTTLIDLAQIALDPRLSDGSKH